jgi:hypothetical protein
MRHDKQYRRVLRSQDYFLQKYKSVGVMAFFAYYVMEAYKDKKIKQNNKKLKAELNKIEEEAEKDLSKSS